jgi:hypothetical protein
MAYAGRFGFLIPALQFRIRSDDADHWRLALSGKDWPAKVSRERRTKLRSWLAWNARVIFRQRRDAIGDVMMVGAVELIGRLTSGAIAL